MRPRHKRLLFLWGGHVCMFFAVLRYLVPVLLPFPFLLIASFFYARSSKRFHKLLRNSRFSGTSIREWENGRRMSLRTKIFTVVNIVCGVGVTTWFSNSLLMDRAWIVVATIAVVYVCTRHKPEKEVTAEHG